MRFGCVVARSGRRAPLEALRRARVAELADAPDLGSGGETRGGSSPPFRTNHLQALPIHFNFLLRGSCRLLRRAEVVQLVHPAHVSTREQVYIGVGCDLDRCVSHLLAVDFEPLLGILLEGRLRFSSERHTKSPRASRDSRCRRTFSAASRVPTHLAFRRPW